MGTSDIQLLSTAVAQCDWQLILKLLHEGVDINTQGLDGGTVLHLAIDMGYDNIACFLVRHGADPDLPSTDGTTPMSMAVSMGIETMLRVFATVGNADIFRQDEDGLSYLDQAYLENQHISATVLMDLGLGVEHSRLAHTDAEVRHWLLHTASGLYDVLKGTEADDA